MSALEKFNKDGGIKRCPNCHRLTLVYDPEQRRIHCTSCGFQATLRA